MYVIYAIKLLFYGIFNVTCFLHGFPRDDQTSQFTQTHPHYTQRPNDSFLFIGKQTTHTHTENESIPKLVSTMTLVIVNFTGSEGQNNFIIKKN